MRRQPSHNPRASIRQMPTQGLTGAACCGHDDSGCMRLA
ncbi:MAG: hypothetical protein OJF55_002983 [Rhodanobacteraceae bacterium]|nr:MAG: hypothetical protein OJF55_002983 [Rhodanobacteraceae bacterium]